MRGVLLALLLPGCTLMLPLPDADDDSTFDADGQGGQGPATGGSELSMGGAGASGGDWAMGGALQGAGGKHRSSGGDSSGAGGELSGTGGESPGVGGGSPGAGGELSGVGGDSPGAGGDSPGAGGESPGAGGDSPGAGGDSPGAGGSGDECDSPCDCDGDGSLADTMECGGDDCDDEDDRVHPGQNAYFAERSENPAVSFDFNCSEAIERAAGQQESVDCLAISLGFCGTAQGYLDTLPACGEAGSWGECTSNGLGCEAVVLDSSVVARCH